MTKCTRLEKIAEEMTQKISDEEGYLDDDQWEVCFSAVKDGLRKGVELCIERVVKCEGHSCDLKRLREELEKEV